VNETCSPLSVAFVASALASLLGTFVAFGVYSLATSGWLYFVAFAAGAPVALAVLSVLLTYLASALLQG